MSISHARIFGRIHFWGHSNNKTGYRLDEAGLVYLDKYRAQLTQTLACCDVAALSIVWEEFSLLERKVLIHRLLVASVSSSSFHFFHHGENVNLFRQSFFSWRLGQTKKRPFVELAPVLVKILEKFNARDYGKKGNIKSKLNIACLCHKRLLQP